MGKSRGGKYYHAKTKGPRKGPEDEEGSDEEEFEPAQRGIGNQRANVGMLPPSDSEGEEGEAPAPKADAAKADPAAKAEPSSSQPSAQSKNAGKMPPSDDDDSEGSSDDDDPTPEYLRAAPTARKKVVVEEPRSEEQVRKDLERLELIRKKREDDRLRRIATEGWDRYAPVTDANRPPGSVPTDHPSKHS